MASPKIKFRCYKCNQLLGVSSSKAGKVVACPKCSTDLVIPDADESPAPAGPAAASESTPAFLAALDSGLPVEIADIRPEDIRVATDDDWTALPVDVDAPRSGPAPVPAPEPAPFLAPLEPGPGPADTDDTTFEIASYPTPLSVPIPSAPVDLVEVPQGTAGAPASAVATVLPPIKVAPPSISAERTPMARSRDLVLPRSVVATWSLFVLMAQALAFVAGLLAGHYLWRVH